MHLKRVILKNFRCFENLEIALHPRLTVLVAENGGGKTAMLDGIAFGLAPVLNHLSSANQRLPVPAKKDTDLRLVAKAGRGVKESWVASDFAQVEIELTTGLKWDRVQSSKKGRQPESKIGQAGLSAYTSRIYDGLQGQGQELLPVFAYYGARRGWIAVPGRLRESKINYDFPTSALVGALDSLSDFKEMLKWFDRTEAAELRANKGLPRQDWDESSALNSVRWTIEAIVGDAYHNPQFNNRHQFVVESGTIPGMFLQVEQLSQGYQSMLALGMDFARRLAVANSHLDSVGNLLAVPGISECFERIRPATKQNHSEKNIRKHAWHTLSATVFAPALMLVDEIDLHLHPAWQQRVLGDLMEAFPCTQFIVTTHSPQVLTTLRKENIRILGRDEDDKWTAQEPSISPLAHESGDALALIMNTHPRPNLEYIMPDLYAYEQLARAGRADSEEARRIKARLDTVGYEFNEADLSLFSFLAAKAGKSKQETP